MSRYTTRGRDYIEHMKTVGVWDFQRIYESLQYYEDMEEDGLLINLPCKIGDTTYRGIHAVTEHSPFRMQHGVSKERVTAFEVNECGIYVKTDKYVYPVNLFTAYLFSDKQTAYDSIVERTKHLEDGEDT